MATIMNDGLKKAMLWLSEQRREQPGRKRIQLIEEAGVRFDLTPLEVQFLVDQWREDGVSPAPAAGR